MPLRAQVIRTRDVGFAAVRYDNGLALGALSLFESAALNRLTGDLNANGLVSLFSDGRWSTQGSLVGTRVSGPLPLSPGFRRFFSNVRGELVLDGGASAQQGLMPTMQVLGGSRLRFEADQRRLNVGASVARTFDGTAWRTTVIGEGSAYFQTGPSEYRLTFTPMQLSGGDVMGDWEGGLSTPWKRGQLDASLGVRLGEAQRGTVAWGAVTLVVPWRNNLVTTFSIGNYPVDLLQGLPGGRYAAVNLRIPNGKLSWRRPRVAVPLAPVAPVRPELLVTERLAVTIGAPYDSAQLREVRVWAPGVTKVELVADFTQWVPVPMIAVGAGEWHGYYHVSPGAHRLNVLLNGTELDVPSNLARELDDFNGAVGVILVR
ncbi:MAG: hypothetical protein U0163_06290 [Gemmatimonadaceae bacterium]